MPSVSWVLTRRFDPYDAAACARAHDIVVAATSIGRPWHHPPSLAESVLDWRHDDPGERMEMWEVVDVEEADGAKTVVGVGTLWVTLDDNVDKAWVEVTVHPGRRRRGAGRALVEQLVARAREEGRTEVLAEVLVPPPSDGDTRPHPYLRFAGSVGFVTTSTEIGRHLRLPVDPSLLHSLEARSRPHWEQDYALETHVDGVPPHRQEGLCELMNRLGVDAPTGDVVFEPESLTPDRYRRTLRLLRDQGRSLLTTLAIHSPTGCVVAYTDLVLLADPNPVVLQWGTLVEGAHRGHRLGTAVKVANLRALASRDPTRERVVTCNDDTNRWMVEVNAALGFEVVEVVPALRRTLS